MASIPYGLYKIYTNGIPYIQVLPAYNVSSQFVPISPQEAQQIMQSNPDFYKNSGTADLTKTGGTGGSGGRGEVRVISI